MGQQSRATVRAFTVDEMRYLREGMSLHGPQWKLIHQKYPFDDRTKWDIRKRGLALIANENDTDPSSISLPGDGKLRSAWTVVEEEQLKDVINKYNSDQIDQIVRDSLRLFPERSLRSITEKARRVMFGSKGDRIKSRNYVLLDSPGPISRESSRPAEAARYFSRKGYELLRIKEDGTELIHVFTATMMPKPNSKSFVYKVLKLGIEYDNEGLPVLAELSEVRKAEKRKKTTEAKAIDITSHQVDAINAARRDDDVANVPHSNAVPVQPVLCSISSDRTPENVESLTGDRDMAMGQDNPLPLPSSINMAIKRQRTPNESECSRLELGDAPRENEQRRRCSKKHRRRKKKRIQNDELKAVKECCRKRKKVRDADVATVNASEIPQASNGI